MKERPILFSAPMVLALRSDRKTQTRRNRGLDKINEAPDDYVLDGGEHDPRGWTWQHFAGPVSIRCPYGVPGDRLYTREAFYVASVRSNEFGIGYRADHPTGDLSTSDGGYNFRPFSDEPEQAGLQWNWVQMHQGTERWIPSIHMPRWASRDTLEVVSVRPERLQSITEEDAKAEGFGPRQSVALFRGTWSVINGPDSWAKNPWVWRIEYRRLSATQEPGESAGSLSDQEGKN